MKMLAMLVLTASALAGCTTTPEKEGDGPAKFAVGDMVRTKVGGYEGQVVRAWYYTRNYDGWHYNVRLALPAMTTKTHVLRQDDAADYSAMRIVDMRGYELEAAQAPKEAP